MFVQLKRKIKSPFSARIASGVYTVSVTGFPTIQIASCKYDQQTMKEPVFFFES